ncbi:efflux RND transporter periplasmic adaptor subunit [Noviherbaspirillum pedocola]|uniref:Efflux RND transporter periplasmic adaptor subunit n=1 Tax=Noviherbaspirillum pedocola TaxID=2801341 RepID=A0A934SS28_9BURK|nr:efflux RND transporter periplasmic adaptor subunit [Noviherbaspirillum pedocola]MBK4734557.1 efflux RND transporter periplasmic adaptor subunit [Noviherbaspirillum pedocola]
MDTRSRDPQTPPKTTTSRPRRLLGSVIAILVLLALAALAWHLTHKQEPTAGARPGAPGAPGGRGMPVTTVGVGAAEQVALPVTLDAIGTVTPPATVTVRPQVSGVMQQVLFTEGQEVKAGQVLALIDPRQFEMALMQATGQRQKDEAQLENARLTLQRYQTLLAQDSIARQDVDTQAALVRQLEGTVVADRAAEGTAKLNLGYTKVMSPISGRVGLRNVDVGNIVSGSDANGIAVVTQIAPIDVVFAIPQDRVPELRQDARGGMHVTALDRTRNTVLAEGGFHALDNQVDVQTGTVKAKARFTNEQRTLFPNQFVNVRLLLRTIPEALTVPVNALRHGSNGDYVYVLNAQERTVAFRKVTTGLATVDRVQIVSGLEAGEKVITEGADRLKDGDKVALPADRPATPQGTGGQRRRQGGAAGQGAGKRGHGGDAAAANAGSNNADASGNTTASTAAAGNGSTSAPGGNSVTPAAADKGGTSAMPSRPRSAGASGQER